MCVKSMRAALKNKTRRSTLLVGATFLSVSRGAFPDNILISKANAIINGKIVTNLHISKLTMRVDTAIPTH